MIDVVAGYARGYNAEQIRPFLKSLRNSGFDGRILLFANGGAAEEAKKWDVDLRAVPKPRIKVHSARFVCIEEALRDIPCEGIFLTDTRDVVFQKNPGEYLPPEGLNVYLEDQSMSIGTCPYNSLWISLGYTGKVLEKLSNSFISCVGCSCGDRDSVLFYLKRLVEEVQRIQPRTDKPQDQAAHNYLIREELDCRVWDNEEGEVYTVGYIHRGHVKIKDNKIINMDGDIPAVIHQWDRHKNLETLIKATL